MTLPREFDVVLYGATGFTGTLVAHHLASRSSNVTETLEDRTEVQRPLRWAIAGRSRAKLASLLAELEAKHPTAALPAVLEADARDASSLESMAARTRVVLTTVGPFEQHGEPVVAACVARGAHYADITGEPVFVQRMLDRYDGPARAASVRVVNCCGFDSIPHDLGVQMLVEALAPTGPLSVRGYVRANAAMSGGTWQSALGAMANMRAQSARDAMRGPARDQDGRRVSSLSLRPNYVRALGAWALPMPTIDPVIVLRSARALAAYGPEFRYGHFALVRRAPTAAALVLGVGAVSALAQWERSRAWLSSKLPSGEGPSEEKRARSSFECTFIGESQGRTSTVIVRGGDPGYSETAKMAGESALCLALDAPALPPTYGVLTTAVAMGSRLRARIERQGITFELRPGR